MNVVADVIAVQGTNDDAQISKLACVRLGYFRDDFVHLFVKKPLRRSPLINRGYYARYAALRTLLFQFLAVDPGARKQVLVLGAGYDTAFFQLNKEGLVTPGLTFVELDFPAVTRTKAAAIERTPALWERVANAGGAAATSDGGGSADAAVWVDGQQGAVHSPRYRLQPADLRNIPELESALHSAALDYSLPTFVLAECVLVYMQPAASAAVVQFLAQRLPTAALAVYEQVNPSDAFGRQMMVNLESRGAPLLGILPSLQAHAQRLTRGGWQRAQAKSMAEVYRDCIDPADRRRIERLEMFDEFEEWNLFQDHYAVALAVNDASGLLKNFGFPRFQPPPPPQFKPAAPRPPPL